MAPRALGPRLVQQLGHSGRQVDTGRGDCSRLGLSQKSLWSLPLLKPVGHCWGPGILLLLVLLPLLGSHGFEEVPQGVSRVRPPLGGATPLSGVSSELKGALRLWGSEAFSPLAAPC